MHQKVVNLLNTIVNKLDSEVRFTLSIQYFKRGTCRYKVCFDDRYSTNTYKYFPDLVKGKSFKDESLARASFLNVLMDNFKNAVKCEDSVATEHMIRARDIENILLEIQKCNEENTNKCT